MNETMRLRTQNEAIAAIKGSLFIVGSIGSNGDFSVAASPTVHRDITSARMEAKRLAGVYTGKLFVILNLAGGELIPTTSLSI